MATNERGRRRSSNTKSGNDNAEWRIPDPNQRAFLDLVQSELDVIDQKVHAIRSAMERELLRRGSSFSKEAITIQGIIASLMDGSAERSAWHLGTADYESIVRIAQEEGIAPARLDSWLKKLEATGHVYRPSGNRYLLAKPLVPVL